MGNKIYRAVGCPECGETGYVGRKGLYEVMPVNRELQKVIISSTLSHEIEETAISCGMRTMQRSGLDAILSGEITIDEYLRVLGASND
jgi:type II secretory ATPase GspE/PulE/Tfp pilus assembly ATPase PilB-like protein